MHVLNTFFDKIYCITVHDFYDRHVLVREQLKNINFEWIFSPPPEIILSRPPLSISETSLIFGHLSCIWNAKINGYKRIAIWEDDGIIISDEVDMSNFLSTVPYDWDCLYLGNASWNDGIWPVRTRPVSDTINKIYWATGSSFNAIQSHVFDTFIKIALSLTEPVDFVYYRIFERDNSYSPSKKFFSDALSIPNEINQKKVSNLSKFIPSKIKRGGI